MAKVRIGDVAREVGVSLGTVSNAINHPERVKPETLALINDAISRLGYVPNQAARQLAGTESRVFGLALPRLDHAFSLQIANGAQAESHANGYDLLIASAGNDDLLENHYLRYFLGAHIAGVLVQPMATSSWRPALDKPMIPTVYLDVHHQGLANCIAPDNEAQGRLILQHARACGSERVAVIGEARFTQLALRVRGICDAAREACISVELIGRGDWNTAEDGFQIGRRLAERPVGHRPDFVVGLTDVLAAGAIDGIMAAGLSVPDDMLVAGCDGNPLAWSGSVPLTTIASPGYELGRLGVRHLLAQIGGKELTSPPYGHAVPKLIERASTCRNPGLVSHVEVPDLNLAEYLGSPSIA